MSIPSGWSPEEVRKRLEAATPGPWWFDGRDILTARVSGKERSIVVPLPETFHHEQQVLAADAALIAHAPEDIAALLALLDEAKEALEDYAQHGCRHDLNPTRYLYGGNEQWAKADAWWITYIARMDESVKRRARAFLARFAADKDGP